MPFYKELDNDASAIASAEGEYAAFLMKKSSRDYRWGTDTFNTRSRLKVLTPFF